jgi:hypothetical protein
MTPLTPAALAALPLTEYRAATHALVKACDALTAASPDARLAQARAWGRIVSAAMQADTALQGVTDALHAATTALGEEV